MLVLKEIVNRSAKANEVRWYGQVLRRDDDSVLRVALNLNMATESEDVYQRRSGRTKWKRRQRMP